MNYKIITPLSPLWQACLALYLDAFPPDERREHSELEAINSYSGYLFNAILENDKIAGILETWEFGTFRFLEHIAIVPDLQGKGFGSRVLHDYLIQSVKPVFLEAEPPTDAISLRRVQFYLKSGFNIVDFDYTQPPYYPGKNSVPMVLMSNASLQPENIVEALKIIKENVYRNI